MSENLTLYDLEEGLMSTVQTIAQMEAEGHKEGLAEALQALEAYIKESVVKRDNCGRYLMSLDAIDDAIDSQIAWLQDKQRKIRNRREKFSKHMLFVMNWLGVKKLEGAIFSFKAQQNPVSVVIEDESKIPAEYLQPPKPAPIPQPDKKAIKDALIEGKTVPGASLKQETRLVIYQ